ncbi:MAG: HD domain-containing protein [Candidatus Omnitrophica bacterium]|nr:HD domain-containing protein [Candidatus Omnitrophota bacterium]
MTSFEYHEALKNAAKSMVRVKNPRRLLKMIARFIEREVGLTHSSILIFDPPNRRYLFVDSKGDRRIPVGLVRLDADNPLIRWFSEASRSVALSRDFITANQVERLLSNETFLEQNRGIEERLCAIREQMRIFKAAVCVPGFFKGELLGLLLLGRKQDQTDFSLEELTFFQTLANDASMTIKMAEYHDDLVRRNRELEEQIEEVTRLRKKEQETYYQIILSLAREVHARDAYTSGHMEEVEKLGLMTAEAMNLNLEGKRRDILVAALHLHDVGKIGIPDSILKKEEKLTEEEWLIMRDHVFKGARILEPLDDFKEVARIIMLHHENFDGSGYPYGLKGEEIPIEARIINVVDTFHAIVSSRCYRRGRPFEQAVKELERCAGKQFDPAVVRAFIETISRRIQPRYDESTGLELKSRTA